MIIWSVSLYLDLSSLCCVCVWLIGVKNMSRNIFHGELFVVVVTIRKGEAERRSVQSLLKGITGFVEDDYFQFDVDFSVQCSENVARSGFRWPVIQCGNMSRKGIQIFGGNVKATKWRFMNVVCICSVRLVDRLILIEWNDSNGNEKPPPDLLCDQSFILLDLDWYILIYINRLCSIDQLAGVAYFVTIANEA